MQSQTTLTKKLCCTVSGAALLMLAPSLQAKAYASAWPLGILWLVLLSLLTD